MAYTSPSITASGSTFAQFQGGMGGHLDRLITANLGPTVNPTPAPTVAVTGGGSSGGKLAAAVYFLSITETNGIGETLSIETASSFTVAAGNIPRVTFPTLQTGNVARNVYLTLAGGATGTEVLYADGITASTFDLTYAHPAITVPAPTVAPTVAATGGGSTGGFVAAGVYFLSITETNGAGQSTALETAATFTVAAGNIPQVTFPTLQAGNIARNVYLTLPAGLTGTEVLYATGITTSTYNLAVAAPASTVKPPTLAEASTSAILPPATNTTILSSKQLELLRAVKAGNLQNVWGFARAVGSAFNEGQPMSDMLALKKWHDAHVVFSVIATMFAEGGTLIDANPGHFVNVGTPIGGQRVKRQWN